MDRLKYLLLILLFISCNSVDVTPIVHWDTGVVTQISNIGNNINAVTIRIRYKNIKGLYFTENLIFYTNQNYNINDTIRFSRKQ